MARVNVYLPDELVVLAKEAGLNLSAVAQEAVRRTLSERSTDAWMTETRARRVAMATVVAHERGLVALDEARDESPTRHG